MSKAIEKHNELIALRQRKYQNEKRKLSLDERMKSLKLEYAAVEKESIEIDNEMRAALYD